MQRRILSGSRHFTENEERPVGFDLHAHMRLAHKALLELGGNRRRELLIGQSTGRQRTDQRQVGLAARIDDVAVGDAVLTEDDDTELVACVKRIGPIGDGWRRRRIAVRCCDIRAARAGKFARLFRLALARPRIERPRSSSDPYCACAVL